LQGIIDSSIQPNYDTSSLLPALNTSRTIKDHDEITAIRHAIKISSIAHRTILHHITTLKSEAEVHAFYLDVCIAHGTQLQAYPPIVGSGNNALFLHYFDNNDSLKGKSLVCMDAGAEWECYASDITRTFPLTANGWPSKETAEIYALVEEMQERCIAMLGPGVRYLDAFFLADRIATAGLMRLGILKGEDVEEVLESQVIRAMFLHGLGHHLGLDVHDVRSISIFEQDSRGRRINDKQDFRMQHAPCTKEAAHLEPGMVITVEPGICMSSRNESLRRAVDVPQISISSH
jgi:Xaa-Pro dipeptidase